MYIHPKMLVQQATYRFKIRDDNVSWCSNCCSTIQRIKEYGKIRPLHWHVEFYSIQATNGLIEKTALSNNFKQL